MFEDLWAATSWASIDSLGRQKVVYYTAKDIYRPVIGYAYWNVTTSQLSVWATSDRWASVSGTLTAEWFDFNGKPLSVPADNAAPSKHPFTIGPINSTHVLEYSNLVQTFKAHGVNETNAVLRLSLTASSDDGGGTYSHVSWFHPASLANASLHDPGLKLSHHSGGGRGHGGPGHHPPGTSVNHAGRGHPQAPAGSSVSFTVTATTAVAAWVWLDCASSAVRGYWSENGFWLNRGESKVVTFTVWSDTSGGKWVESVGVRSVWDNDH